MEWFTKVVGEYANFEGRARRTEYWMFALFYLLFYVAAVVVDMIIMLATGIPFPALTVVYLLGMIIPALAVTVRRLHDTDRSGWWVLINLVPFGGIVLLVFLCTEGSPMPNQYGPSPKAYASPPGYQHPMPA